MIDNTKIIIEPFQVKLHNLNKLANAIQKQITPELICRSQLTRLNEKNKKYGLTDTAPISGERSRLSHLINDIND